MLTETGAQFAREAHDFVLGFLRRFLLEFFAEEGLPESWTQLLRDFGGEKE